MLSNPQSSRRALQASHQVPEELTFLVAPLSFAVTLTMTLFPIPVSLRLLLPGITFQINQLHPSPVSGSAFGEPSPKQTP